MTKSLFLVLFMYILNQEKWIRLYGKDGETVGRYQTLKPEADFSLGELLYYLFFGIMLFSKGMGWYDGMPEYRICLVIGVLCLIIKLLLDKYTLWECLLIGVFGLLGIMSWIFSREKGMLTCVMILIGMKGIPIQRVFKVGAVIWGSVFGYRILAFLMGMQTGIVLVHNKLGLGHIFRWSMGYPHPNVFHISYVILLAFLFYLLRPQGKRLLYAVSAAFAGNCFIFLYSVSFTGFILTVVYLALVVYFTERRRFTRLEKIGIMCVLPVCLICSFALPLIPEGKLFTVLNKLMNTRLQLSRYFLQNQSISLFGQKIVVPDSDLNIDNSFLFALMNYGLIIFILLMLAYFLVIRYMIKNEEREKLAVTLGFLIAGISEPFLFNTSFKNITLVFVGGFLLSKAAVPVCISEQSEKIGVTTVGKKCVSLCLPITKGEVTGQNKREKKIRIAMAAGCTAVAVFAGGIVCANRLEMPKGYICPRSVCDWSEQESFLLTREEAEQEEEAGMSIPYYVDEETPMYRFTGNIVRVEYIRSIAGRSFLCGLAGGVAGTAIMLILEQGRKKRKKYEK